MVKVGVPAYFAYSALIAVLYGVAAAPYYRSVWRWFHTLVHTHAGQTVPPPPQ